MSEINILRRQLREHRFSTIQYSMIPVRDDIEHGTTPGDCRFLYISAAAGEILIRNDSIPIEVLSTS